MTDSYEIMSSVFAWLNIIEMSKFVDDGMLLQMITLIICQNMNTSTTRTNDAFIQISRVLTPYHWENVSDFKASIVHLRTFNHQEDGGEQFAPTLYWKNKQWEVGIEFVLYNGASGKTPGGLLTNSKSQGRGKQSLGKERRDPLLTVL